MGESTITAIVRKNREAVSPVIAEILLIAIAVILAAVLYLMVSGLFVARGPPAPYVGVNLSGSPAASNWILSFTSVPTGLGQNDTTLVLVSANGTLALPATSLYQLEASTNGVRYVPVLYGANHVAVSVGDQVLISTSAYPTGTKYEFVSGGAIIATGTLQ